jgi:hypothetical protein
MPRGPKGEKRPADVIGNAVKVMRIAVGEEIESNGNQDTKKDASNISSLGGQARSKSLSKEDRSRIAKNAASLRWAARTK